MGGPWERVGSIIVLATFYGCVSTISIVEERVDVIGIDFGTSNSRVGFYNKRGKVQVHSIPSWVAFTETETLIGEDAENQAADNPETTIFDIKRFIGTKFEDEEVQKEMKLVPFKVVNKDGKPYIQVKTEVFSPEKISAMILSKLIKQVEQVLGKKINDAVLTVPAYFNDAQRQAIRKAGETAGLKVGKIINESTAAAIAYYSLDKNLGGGEKSILVFDVGGATFDVSVLKVVDDGTNFKLVATNGDTHLGGKDFDNNTMEKIIKWCELDGTKAIREDKKALEKLRRGCEGAKRHLSSQDQFLIEIEPLVDTYDLSKTLTRAEFEDCNENLFNKIMQLVEKTVKDAGLDKKQIDEIVLVGGSSRIPQIQKLLKDHFNGKEPINGVIKPDEAVAYGATIHAGSIFSTGTGDQETDHQVSRPHHILHTTRQYLIDLTGIPPSPRGTPEIEVKFKVDAYGILNVKAEETGSGESMKISITNEDTGGQLSQEESNRMLLTMCMKNLQINDKLAKRLEYALDWLHQNQNAKKEEYKENLKEVETVCKPIITAVNQRAPHDEL